MQKRKETTTTMLDQLRKFSENDTTVALENLIAIQVFGRLFLNEYKALEITPPDWITRRLAALEREIQRRNEDNLRAQLQEVRNQRAVLATPEEKRNRLDERARELKKKLGIASGA